MAWHRLRQAAPTPEVGRLLSPLRCAAARLFREWQAAGEALFLDRTDEPLFLAAAGLDALAFLARCEAHLPWCLGRELAGLAGQSQADDDRLQAVLSGGSDLLAAFLADWTLRLTPGS
jgi:hypothetical protein